MATMMSMKTISVMTTYSQFLSYMNDKTEAMTLAIGVIIRTTRPLILAVV